MDTKKLIIGGAALLAVFSFCWWQNNMLTVSEYTYSGIKIPAELDGYRIVQISDLHNKSFGKDNKTLLKKIANLDPDLIVITGDIVDSTFTNIKTAVSFANGAAEIAPTYYVTGNHECSLSDDDYDNLTDAIEDGGTYYLFNEKLTIEHNGASFVLTGLDDTALGDDYMYEFMELSSDDLNIVLAHEPQFIEDYAAQNFDLVLSGHAHGGQFRIPFTDIGIIAPDQGFLPKYTSGVHKSGDCTMVISRGLGNSIIPVRLFNYPEIVVVELRSGK